MDIHEASKNGKTEVVKILAALTENPNAPDDSGWTPIHGAAENGYIETGELYDSFVCKRALVKYQSQSDVLSFTILRIQILKL